MKNLVSISLMSFAVLFCISCKASKPGDKVSNGAILEFSDDNGNTLVYTVKANTIGIQSTCASTNSGSSGSSYIISFREYDDGETNQLSMKDGYEVRIRPVFVYDQFIEVRERNPFTETDLPVEDDEPVQGELNKPGDAEEYYGL